jgi:hypothetical protein
VFPITSIVVAAHIDDLLAESAAQRLAKSARVSNRANPFASALNGVWSILRGPADHSAGLPKLTDYPFRS